MNEIVFIDLEVDSSKNKILDIGAIKQNGQEFHSKSRSDFVSFLHGSSYICGHNIFKHDLQYIEKEVNAAGINHFIDTLCLSPLLFPKKPYHKLVKDDKLTTNELNNPLNDAKKARDLFNDGIAEFKEFGDNRKHIFFALLKEQKEFSKFFSYIGYEKIEHNVAATIKQTFFGKICANVQIEKLANKYPVELAYALAQIEVIQYDSITPPWVLINYPKVENVLHFLRSRKCFSCAYCNEALDETKALQRFFHYDAFRSYDGMPLQQKAAEAAVSGKSFIAVFPTGGGKSITFQVPALMAGQNEKGLTVVISPLQSLMKDQTDNLENKHGITEAVTINGSLDPLERAKAFERVEEGSASLLYISPESLRSKSIESLLLKRNVVRFVIDEAHCFSAWGQDFRTDYLYIGDFIRSLQEKKDMPQNTSLISPLLKVLDTLQEKKVIQKNIPISCFTATAKQEVVADIKNYFKEKLLLDLEAFRAGTARPNLTYNIFNEQNNDEKYLKLRQLIIDNDCPTIIYVSRTRRAEELAGKLTEDGYVAKPYHGQMDKQSRIENQDAFISGDVKIIVATTAFGMGVDKKDVQAVIHYDISNSLENYIQEAGRAGRDENIKANCHILFNDEDLNKHFNMLNQTKMSLKEIGQVWRAIKKLTHERLFITKTGLELARESGWDDSVNDIETRVRTAVNALEQIGYIKRGQNMPRVFADSILVHNMEEARVKIDSSPRFDDKSRQHSIRIINSLIGAKYRKGVSEDSEERVDYISDRLGIETPAVIRAIGMLREEKILADAKDITAYIKRGGKSGYSKNILNTHEKVENFLFEYLANDEKTYNIKEMNEALHEKHQNTSIKNLQTILNYFSIKRFIKKTKHINKNFITLKPYFPVSEIKIKSNKRSCMAEKIIDYLYLKADIPCDHNDENVHFSVLELKEELSRDMVAQKADIVEIEDALYYLLKIGALKIEGGFLVIYNAMRIERLQKDNSARYLKEHYSQLEKYYQNKRLQIHIVAEYARRMLNDYKEALAFVDDYFIMDYNAFLNKYFRGRKEEISLNITPKKFKQIFGELSSAQLDIIKDENSACIVVAAGPGSGKTKLLTHKLASLYMMEDVKHEQMLMLTFSRAAASEFKKRLMTLIGNAANFIQITTFHSYCFDLLGKVGDIEKHDNIIEQAIEKINAGEVDLSRLTKTVLVIDEAQDMGEAEYSFVKTLMENNDDLRIIAVGDDDQNIYEFRGSSSKYLEALLKEQNAKKYELVDNYRSNANIVELANRFSTKISHRLKTTSIIAKKKENGIINICKLSSENITIPVVNAVKQTKLSGSTCIITRTNEEALNITGLLLKNGIQAKQIQTNNDFNLCNLAELRDFIADIDTGEHSYTISQKVWDTAKYNLNVKYKTSNDLQVALKLIDDFEETNNRTKYKSDFKQFVRESKLESFVTQTGSSIFVSTIHQTKGREFDNVFLAFSSFKKMNDEQLRAIYVAITRAKQNLYIYYCGDYLDGIYVQGIQKNIDITNYPEPIQITVQMSHKDVFLGYFAQCQVDIDLLRCGDKLLVRDGGLYRDKKQIAKFSKKFKEDIEKLKDKGYVPKIAKIRHVVFWQNKEKENEIKIILPDMEFKKIDRQSR